METFENTNNVNGPINVVRCVGEINGIQKVIYVYFDMHVNYYKCSDLINLDIAQFLTREFYKINSDPNIKKL